MMRKLLNIIILINICNGLTSDKHKALTMKLQTINENTDLEMDIKCKDIINKNLFYDKNVYNKELLLTLDTTKEDELMPGDAKRYYFILNETSPLIIIISPNIVWSLYYNQKVNLTNLINNNIKFSCSPPGRYDIFLSNYNNIVKKFNITASIKRLYDTTMPKVKIRFQKRSQRREAVIKWDKSKLDIHAMHYCLVVSTIKSQPSLCEAIAESLFGGFKNLTDSTTINYSDDVCNTIKKMELFFKRQNEKKKKIDNNGTTISCTGTRSQQLLRGLRTNQLYHINIFALHTQLNNFSYLHGKIEYLFTRTQPTQLYDDKTIIGRLTDLGGLFLANYKIQQKQLLNNYFLLYIVPCGGSINILITKQRSKMNNNKNNYFYDNHLKNININNNNNKNLTNIYKPTIIRIDNVTIDEKYLIKILPTNDDDLIKVTRVEITVTQRDQFHQYPQIPINTSVIQLTRGCKQITIGWYDSPDPRRVRYCVSVLQSNYENNSNEFDVNNYCGLDTRLCSNPQFQEMHCFSTTEKRDELQKFSVTGLSAGRHYVIYVTVSLMNYKIIPYEPIGVHLDSFCRKHVTGIGAPAASSMASGSSATGLNKGKTFKEATSGTSSKHKKLKR